MKPFSIIIPIYNEQEILVNQIKRILNKINKLNSPLSYEVILVENGSTDKTRQLARELANKYPQVKLLTQHFPSYGQAFKMGLKKAQYPYIFQFDIDFWDIGFIVKAQKLLDKYNFVIGSKNLNHSIDQRPIIRKFISKLLEKAIGIRFKVSLSDTHGLKALKKDLANQFIDKVKCPNHFFDSELLLRMTALGLSFIEVPVNLKEIRGSRFSFLVRSSEVIKEFLSFMFVKLEKQKVTYKPFAYEFQKTAIKYIMQLFI